MTKVTIEETNSDGHFYTVAHSNPDDAIGYAVAQCLLGAEPYGSGPISRIVAEMCMVALSNQDKEPAEFWEGYNKQVNALREAAMRLFTRWGEFDDEMPLGNGRAS